VYHPCRLALTRRGLLRRNNAVYSAAFAAGTPLVIVFGGGYSRPIDASVAAHADVFRSAALRVAGL
jgi:acetoin utilization deacetylase AcuC-like enzyme